MNGRFFVGLACGAAVGWIARAEREHIEDLFEEAAARSRAAADALRHGAPEPAAWTPAPEPPPAPEREPDAVAEPAPAPAPIRVVAVERLSVPPIEPPRRRRRRLALVFAIAAVVCGLVAAGAASWRLWGRAAPGPGPAAAASATPSAVTSLLADPTATRLPVRGTTAVLTLIVGRADRAALVGSGLAPAPTGRPYAAWVVRAGEPTRAALFPGGDVAVALSRPVPPGATVAVTLGRTPVFHVTRGLPRSVLAILSQYSSSWLPLTGSHGELTAVVGRGDHAILISSGLPPATAGTHYEVWVTRGRRALAAGEFVGGRGRDVIALTRLVPKGATVAVTLERAGGVRAPTRTPPYHVTRSLP